MLDEAHCCYHTPPLVEERIVRIRLQEAPAEVEHQSHCWPTWVRSDLHCR